MASRPVATDELQPVGDAAAARKLNFGTGPLRPLRQPIGWACHLSCQETLPWSSSDSSPRGQEIALSGISALSGTTIASVVFMLVTLLGSMLLLVRSRDHVMGRLRHRLVDDHDEVKAVRPQLFGPVTEAAGHGGAGGLL